MRTNCRSGTSGTTRTRQRRVTSIGTTPSPAAIGSRDDVMGAIADATGGVTQSLESADPSSWARAKAATANVDRHQQIPLWNTWIALLAIASVLSLDWWLRRRWGYV